MQTHGARNPRYVRFAALGDSTTVGIGDPVAGGWRGWARILAQSLAGSYDVSFCNLAAAGATAQTVLQTQLADAVAHRPDLASLIVGVNDVLKSTWDAGRVRDELVTCADALTGQGAVLLSVRFHDHSALWPLPGWVRRAFARRLDELNTVWDEVVETYGGLRVDLAIRPEIRDRRSWSVDRMHPSELGHRCLARAFAAELRASGLAFEPPGAEADGGIPPSWRRDVAWMVAEGAPWLGRRARDLGPWAVRVALGEGRADGRTAGRADRPAPAVGAAR